MQDPTKIGCRKKDCKSIAYDQSGIRAAFFCDEQIQRRGQYDEKNKFQSDPEFLDVSPLQDILIRFIEKDHRDFKDDHYDKNIYI